MDDMGMGYAANMAGIALFEQGVVTSASVMIPCAWAYDFIQWSQKHPQYDVGIHITHTCEWKAAKWRPLSPSHKVQELIDENGFLWEGKKHELSLVAIPQLKEESEIQIDQAVKWGLKPSHVDNHMWTFASKIEFLNIYLDIAKQNQLIPHIPQWSLWDDERILLIQKTGYPIIKSVEIDMKLESLDAIKLNLIKKLTALDPGIYVLTIHPIIDTPEIRTIIPSWEHRYQEFLLFMDSNLRSMLLESGVNLVTWNDVKSSLK